MTNSNGHRPITNGDDLLRSFEKRIGHQERRPQAPAAITPATSLTGVIVGWPTEAPVPEGYIAANGATVSRIEYPYLAALLGATGATFALPNVPGSGDMRFIVKT